MGLAVSRMEGSAPRESVSKKTPPAHLESKPPTRVVLVGTGTIAAVHAAVLRGLPEVELLGVCDRDAAKAEAFARAHHVGFATASVPDLVQALRPEVAHVLVPPQHHACVAGELLDRGVSVFVEKPIALRGSDARALAERARGAGRVAAVNHNFVFHPLFRRLEADVKRGAIGRVERVLSFQNNPLRQFTAGDFGNWLFENPENVFFEQGPHALSQIVALLGAPTGVRSEPSGRRDVPGGGVFFDTWDVTLTFGEVQAQLTMRFAREFPESWLYVVGQDGALRADLLTGAYSFHRKSRWPEFWDQMLTGRRDAREAAAAGRAACFGYVGTLLRLHDRRDPFFVGMKESLTRFHRALRAGERPPATAEDGAALVDLCEAVTAPARAAVRVRPPAEPRALLPFTEPRLGEVAILGASGFVGGHLVERLTREGVPVRILLRRPRIAAAWLRHPLTRFVEGDLADASALERLVEGAAAVVHLASGGGDRYADFERTIVFGTDAVAQACLRAKVPRLLYASTVAALYLGRRGRAGDELEPDPKPQSRSHYARAKIESERRLRELHVRQGLPVVVLRPAVVVGRRGRPFHSGVGQWPRDTECVGWGDGEGPIPFVLVEDVADAFVKALTAPGIEGRRFNLAGDVRLSAREYVHELALATGRPFHFHPAPLPLVQAADIVKWGVKVAIRRPENPFPSYRDLATRAFRTELDCTGAKDALGWRPEGDRERFVERGIRSAFRRDGSAP